MLAGYIARIDTFFQKLSVTDEMMNTKCWLTVKVCLPSKNLVNLRITCHPDITLAIYLDVKQVIKQTLHALQEWGFQILNFMNLNFHD